MTVKLMSRTPGVSSIGDRGGLSADYGTYFYVLTITGCSTSRSFQGNITVVGSGSGNRLASGDSTHINSDSLAFYNHPITESTRVITKTGGTYSNPGNALKLYPNPASDKVSCLFTVNEVPGAANAELSIENSLGITVKTSGLNSNTSLELDVKDLPSGTYFVKLTYNYTTFKSGLVIIH